MNRFILIILVVTNICLSFSDSYAQQTFLAEYYADRTIVSSVYSTEEFNVGDTKKKLSKKDFIRDTSIYYTALWILRFFYVRNKNARIFDTSFSKWWNNITKPPVTNDRDTFFTNYVVHPFAGAMSFLYYRQMGHDFGFSALGSVVQSTLFEYTIEGLVETPSLPDLISTPLIGVPFGYGLEKTSEFLYNTGNGVAKVAAHIINPMRNTVHDRKIVIFNPLTGRYEFSGTFQTELPPSKQKSIQYGYPIFFEPALPTGYFRTFVEVAELDRLLSGGEFVFYHVKAEFPAKNNFYSAYIRISQVGVNSVEVNGEKISDGFELANVLVGGKAIVYKTDNSVYTMGIDMILPLAYKDNVDRLKTIVYGSVRDFPLYLKGAVTLAPYVSSLHYYKWLSVQYNIGFDLVTRAENLEADSIETRLKYSSAVGISVTGEFINPTIFAEFDGITVFTADTFKKTDLFLTTGVRVGRRIAPGFAVQFPLTGLADYNTKFGYMIDLTIRF